MDGQLHATASDQYHTTCDVCEQLLICYELRLADTVTYVLPDCLFTDVCHRCFRKLIMQHLYCLKSFHQRSLPYKCQRQLASYRRFHT